MTAQQSDVVAQNETPFHKATVFFAGSEYRVAGLYEEAMGFLQIGSEDAKRNAKSRFRTIVDVVPTFAEAHFQLGRLLFENGDREQALVHAADAVRYFRNSAAYRMLLVVCFAALARFIDGAEAIAAAQRDIPSLSDGSLDLPYDPQSRVAAFLRRHIAYIFERFAFIDGRVTDVWTLVDNSLTHFASGTGDDVRGAESALLAIVDQFPSHAEARFSLAEFLRRNGRLEEAVALCEDAERRRIIDWQLLVELGVLNTQLGRTYKAISYFEEAALLNQQLPILPVQHLTDAEQTIWADWHRGVLDRVPIRPGAYRMVWQIPDPPAIAPPPTREGRRYAILLKLAVGDIVAGLRSSQVWWTLAKNDISSRYRRTVLGPWWIVMGTGVALFGMAIVWSTLFGMELTRFFPYLSAGYVIWNFFSSVLMESCNAFTDGHAQAIQKNIETPRCVHLLRLMARDTLLFFHSFSIIVVSEIVFQVAVTPATFLAIPGFILVCLTLMPIAIIFAIIGARYRDFGPALGAVMTLIFFVTPVMWDPGQLGRRAYFAEFNPFTHLLAIVRGPLLGVAPNMTAWLSVSGMCIILWLVALALFARARHRIVYWL